MDISHLLKEAFDKYYILSLNTWQAVEKEGSLQIVSKNTVLKQSNDTEKYLYYMINGSAGNLIWNKENFVCTDLFFAGDLFGDYASYLSQKPSEIELRTFVDSTIFKVNASKIDLLISKGILDERVCTYSAENLFLRKENYQIELLTKTASERYQELLLKQPEVAKNVPQKYIASYLGITPQSFSRIKKLVPLS
jgi:CRP-like cAMP-binding protein